MLTAVDMLTVPALKTVCTSAECQDQAQTDIAKRVTDKFDKFLKCLAKANIAKNALDHSQIVWPVIDQGPRISVNALVHSIANRRR
jgi:hypothetical protein